MGANLGGGGRSIGVTLLGKGVPTSLFFTRQVIQNYCTTHSILLILISLEVVTENDELGETKGILDIQSRGGGCLTLSSRLYYG